MKKISPENFSQVLRDVLGANLRSVILYGSTAAGDHLGDKSDFNLLVVCDKLDLEVLESLSESTNRWVKAGSPPPLLFTHRRLEQSCDVFPIELLDIKENHKVLFGEDPLKDLEISKSHLRHQLEYELRSKVIKLREGYLMTRGADRQVLELLVASLSPLLVLFRAFLRLLKESAEVPGTKRDAMEMLAKRISFNTEPFLQVERLKRGELRARDLNARDLFAGYLSQVERVLDAVNDLNI